MNAHRISWMNVLLACAVLLGTHSGGWGQIITTVAGGGVGDGGPAIQARLVGPSGVFVDGAGSLYIADGHRIRRVDATTGVIITVTGNGGWGFSGDGGAAPQALLSDPYGVFVDGAGDLYIADSGNARIRRVDAATGVITTVAGNGEQDFSGDGGPATQARLARPSGVFVDGAGSLYIADSRNARIRRVDATTGVITTVAGNGEFDFSGDGEPATQAGLSYPSGVFADGAGNLYIADTLNARIRRVDATTGVITTVAGNGEQDFSGDGGPATQAGLSSPFELFVDGAGSLFIADYGNHRIRRVDATTGVITTVAGNGEPGFLGDGGPATQARLSYPLGLFVDGAGDLYIADTGNRRIRRVDATTGVITTVAGHGEFDFSGDGGGATQARLSYPEGVFVDGAGDLYIADTLNARIRRVDATTGVITTVAGNGEFGFSGDGGPATQAGFYPKGLFVDGAGDLYIADYGNHRIRRVDATTGVITTVAGHGEDDFSGDGGPAPQARLARPSGVFVDGVGDLFIADSGNARIRRVDATTGVITTVAGNGEGRFSGDGGPATQAGLSPYGVFVDRAGDLFIADNARIRRVDAATGVITTVAGNGEHDFSGDGGPAPQAGLSYPSCVFVDGAGDLFIADSGNNHRIRRVDATTGVITTVAGNGEQGFSGDGGPATQARLAHPSGVFVDEAGSLYIADTFNYRIRRVDATTGVITAVVSDRLKQDQTATTFTLAPNYPNPFNPHTRIRYQLAQAGPVSLTIYNLLGQRLRVLVQQLQAAGSYEVSWDGKDATGHEVAAGLYVYRLAGSQGVLTRNMMRLK